MKRVKYLHVIRPRVDLDCCYKVRALDTKTRKKCQNKQQSISSSICKNARFNPNFEDPVVVFEVVILHICFRLVFLQFAFICYEFSSIKQLWNSRTVS